MEHNDARIFKKTKENYLIFLVVFLLSVLKVEALPLFTFQGRQLQRKGKNVGLLKYFRSISIAMYNLYMFDLYMCNLRGGGGWGGGGPSLALPLDVHCTYVVCTSLYCRSPLGWHQGLYGEGFTHSQVCSTCGPGSHLMRKLSLHLHVLRSLCCCGAGHDIPIKKPLVQYSRMYNAGDSYAKFLDDCTFS
jgi:hypothetical protein